MLASLQLAELSPWGYKEQSFSVNAFAESAADMLWQGAPLSLVGGSGVHHKEHSSVGFRDDSCML